MVRPSIVRTLVSGIVGGLTLLLGLTLTFATFGGSRRGETGLLFDPATQSPKLIAVWKEIEPLPLLIVSPGLILVGYVAFAVCYAFVYRSVAPAWKRGLRSRVPRLAAILFLTGAFFEMQGPLNLFQQPALPQAIALGFWAVVTLMEAFAIVVVADGVIPNPVRAIASP